MDQNLTHTEEYAKYLEGFVADLLDEMTKFALFYIGTGHIRLSTFYLTLHNSARKLKRKLVLKTTENFVAHYCSRFTEEKFPSCEQ